MSSFFSPDVDNICGVSQVDSIIVSPIFTKKNELLGMVQLLNKEHGVKVSETDVAELGALLPCLARIIQTC